MKITENSAYIKGLFEGLGIDPTTAEGKLFDKLIGIIGDMADAIADLEDECNNLRAYIEEIDEDLGALEEEWYCDDDDCDCCDDDCDCCDCYETTCPACGEKVCIDEDIDPENIVCPACGEVFDCICDGDCDDDCDCCDCCSEDK